MSLCKLETKEASISAENCHDIVDNVISKVESNSKIELEHSEDNNRNKNIQANKELPTITIRMLNFCRELAIFCLVMMTYVAFSKDPPKISKGPAAYRFFPENSIVTDWYRGQISKAIEHARSSDIAFVMFYAPWDADSQKGRNEFEKAAEYMQDYVNFVAVNCWQPLGECRTQYNKVYKWPVLIAYLPHGRGVQYNGPLSAPHFIQFLKKVSNPIKHLGNEGIRDFQDAYIRAEMNVSPGSLDFAVYYTTALRYLEKDPQYRVTFYITPSNVTTPSLSLYMWNETLMFPSHELPWTSEEILKWLFKNVHQITSWALPSGSKSTTLSNSMQNGSVLILFTPRNPLHNNIDYYNMLQEIGQEYFTCEENIVANILAVHLKLRRTANSLIYKHLKSTCNLKSRVFNQKTIFQTKTVWANASACSQKPKPHDCDLLVDKSIQHYCANLKTETCLELFPKIVDFPCKEQATISDDIIKTSMVTGVGDYRSPENLQKLLYRERCKQFIAAEMYHPAIFSKNVPSEKNISIAGLSCRTNKSLSFVAMDSLLHYYFARQLGIDLNNEPDKSAVVILNDKMESHYVLRNPITSESIKEVILNLTKNHLNRSFSSSATLIPPSQPKVQVKTEVVVAELYTDTFLPTILEKDKTVVVLYYTKQCSFCNGVSYIFLTVARKFSLMSNLIFTRIDGDINILPWEYTMETYPTILFFPAKRKSESRVFPSSISITVPNLINFLLVNLEPNLKIQALWSMCVQTKLPKEQSFCYSTLLEETLNLINDTLKEWRKSHKLQRQILLHRLKALRQLHLLFAHTPTKHIDISDYLKKLDLNVRHTEDFYMSKEIKHPRDEL
ncbi:thioredoxin domain-containing protein 11 isoform X1 [Diabrotica virgifera virgifera]|uniref:Thioredoxin domain-containing protein n=1 Tax=Diabrotica virgifera virgifera TaxID=50390 RepID=A0ABM5JLH9_DIAVI|nr:thioredoxin domain-containing protein 11 isoform X1 [Diabrotica virgifera virgifera]